MKQAAFLFFLTLSSSFAFAQIEKTDHDNRKVQSSAKPTPSIDSVYAEENISQGPETVPDLREEELALKLQKRDIVIVPIPISNPTLGSGLVVGGAYFYRQTEQQKKVQPPSVTGAVGFKSSSGSKAFAAGHQSYLDGNKWRIGGALGHADLKLDLRTPGESGSGPTIDWLVRGDFLATKITRRISGKWYAGIVGRYIDMNQGFSFATMSADFNTNADARSVGLGFTVEHDSRDKPLNSYSGHIFEVDAVFNASAFGSDDTYQSYGFNYRSYHSVAPELVLAWEAQACDRSDKAPLWDSCLVNLRGFSATDYLGRSSASAQLEARWRIHHKWGAVAFAGGGYINSAFHDPNDRKLIPSYGIGLRFMVLESQRINIRLDYAKSDDSEAIYLSVGEAF
ncbi:MAG: hypothetical protein ACI9H8_001572 [Lysobacterales bacterium]|jgi:hypothetical protein